MLVKRIVIIGILLLPQIGYAQLGEQERNQRKIGPGEIASIVRPLRHLPSLAEAELLAPQGSRLHQFTTRPKTTTVFDLASLEENEIGQKPHKVLLRRFGWYLFEEVSRELPILKLIKKNIPPGIKIEPGGDILTGNISIEVGFVYRFPADYALIDW